MRFWLVVVVCACSSSHAQQPIGNRVPAGAGGGAFASIAGDWSGRGYQPDTESGWIVGLTLEPRAAVGDRVGTIKYPDLGCSGFLVRLPWTNDAQLRMREQLTVNPTRDGEPTCIDGGTIIVPITPRSDDGTLEWTWFFPDGKQGATAALAR